MTYSKIIGIIISLPKYSSNIPQSEQQRANLFSGLQTFRKVIKLLSWFGFITLIYFILGFVFLLLNYILPHLTNNQHPTPPDLITGYITRNVWIVVNLLCEIKIIESSWKINLFLI